MSKETNKKNEKIELVGTPYPFGDKFRELMINRGFIQILGETDELFERLNMPAPTSILPNIYILALSDFTKLLPIQLGKLHDVTKGIPIFNTKYLPTKEKEAVAVLIDGKKMIVFTKGDLNEQEKAKQE